MFLSPAVAAATMAAAVGLGLALPHWEDSLPHAAVTLVIQTVQWASLAGVEWVHTGRHGVIQSVVIQSVDERRLRLASCVRVDRVRSSDQDPAYGLRLLVDIAIRALSPAVNDPTTAVQALDQIEETLVRLGTRPLVWPWWPTTVGPPPVPADSGVAGGGEPGAGRDPSSRGDVLAGRATRTSPWWTGSPAPSGIRCSQLWRRARTGRDSAVSAPLRTPVSRSGPPA